MHALSRGAQVGAGKAVKNGDRVALHYDCKLRNVRREQRACVAPGS
jgi:hypothetical protein